MISMANSQKTRSPIHAVGSAVLKQIQAEAFIDRNRDDDQPCVPDRHDATMSPQARRALGV